MHINCSNSVSKSLYETPVLCETAVSNNRRLCNESFQIEPVIEENENWD